MKQREFISDIDSGGTFSAFDPSQEIDASPIAVREDTPFLSTIAGFNPSPDWFTGISSLDLRQATSTGQMWYRGFVVDTYPMTAGTMVGATYTDPGTPISPTTTIQPVSLAVFPNVTLPVARWTCQLQEAVPAPNPTYPPTFPPTIPLTLAPTLTGPPTLAPTITSNTPATMAPTTAGNTSTMWVNTSSTVSRDSSGSQETGPHFLYFELP